MRRGCSGVRVAVMSRDAQGNVQEEERCPLCHVWHNKPWQEIHKQELAASGSSYLDRVIN